MAPFDPLGARFDDATQGGLGSVYTGPTEYLVGHIFGHLGVPFTRGRLTDLNLGHLGVHTLSLVQIKFISLSLSFVRQLLTFCKLV